MHAALKRSIYGRTRHFVVPSIGLAEELKHEYGFTASRIDRVPNPIDIDRYAPPPDFDCGEIRRQHNLMSSDIVLVFTALGEFERKGLPLVLEALRDLPEAVKLLVVGGNPDLVRAYSRRAAMLGVEFLVSDLAIVLGLDALNERPGLSESHCGVPVRLVIEYQKGLVISVGLAQKEIRLCRPISVRTKVIGAP